MKRVVLLTLLLAACSAKPDAEDAKPTALVTTAVAERGTMEDVVAAYGAAEIAPNAEHGLPAPIEALVSSIAAPAGTLVRAGQPVVVLAPSPTSRLETEKAAHDAVLADAAYARAQRLRTTGLDSDADVETARAAAASADEASRSLSARAGAGLVLRAPVAGVVEAIALAPGDLAAAGANVAKVGDPAALRARLGVEPALAARIRIGDPVRLSPSTGGTETMGSVLAVDPRADPQTRLASVSVRLESGQGLAPGGPVRAAIVLARRAGAVLIPRAGVLYDQDQPYVFTVTGGSAHRVNVGLGGEQGDRVEVVKGLAAGVRIVVDGAAALDEGMAVREAPAAQPASAGAAK
jgi:RND family efflux transporter MFP subunit